jgi:hypothetical protein
MSKVPVVFLVYNRLETTTRVFARIADARPDTLLIVADGPRTDQPGDAERCEAVRKLVSHPGWPCDVRLNLAPSNLGFRRRISSGLKWAFEQFEEAIILEDDCLPEPSFFPFCSELLERYRFDDRIMMISGGNFQFGRQRGEGSYYFSNGVGTWGWATWRRSIRHLDPDLRDWSEERDRSIVRRIWSNSSIVDYWCARIDEVRRGDVDTWDYQWAFAMWRRGGWQVAPNVNLISYIGCLPDSAHTSDPKSPFCEVPTAPMTFPLRHPARIERDVAADLFEFYRVFLYQEDSTAAANADAAAVAAGRPEA